MDTTSLAMYKDPTNLQQKVIEDIEKRFNNEIVLCDPNDVAMHVIEMTVGLTSGFAFAAENAIASTNVMLAQTTDDLYRNMSDYDYVNLFSKPSKAVVQLNINKQYLLDNAYNTNETTKKILIPRDTVFKLGNLNFGVFYPIVVEINTKIGAPRIKYDLSITNPLQGLTHNLVSFSEYRWMTVDMIQMEFEVHQFTCSKHIEVLVAEHGFSKKYDYTDRFFAVRLFTEKDGVMHELGQTLSKYAYDAYTVTARVVIEPEVNKFSIHIPQIYFSTGMMGPKLFIELYTTKGDIDTDISSIPPSLMSVNFNITKDSDKYAQVLAKSPIGQPTFIVPRSAKLVGGSNGYTFEDLRRRIINNSLHTRVLVTPADLENYYLDSGFRIVRYKDDLTNITYFSYKTLTDSQGGIIPVTTAPIYLTPDLYKETSTIKRNLDGTMTILPTTLYRYSDTDSCCYPVTDVELKALDALDKESVVTEMNNNEYVRSPFHIRLIPDEVYSKVASYNLYKPEITNFLFEQENLTVASQMVAVSGVVTHLNDGTGGYKVSLLVNKSSDIKNTPEDDIFIWVYTKASDGMTVGIRATYTQEIGTDSLYEFTLGTDYYINRNHKFNITTFTDANNTQWSHLIDLTSEFKIVFMMKSGYFDDTVYTEPMLFEGVFPRDQNNQTVLLRQGFTLTLGYALDDVIYNNIDLQWTQELYATHQVDEQLFYPYDIYLTDETGVPVSEVVVDEVSGEKRIKLTVEHKRGEPVFDELGHPMFKHKIGEIIRDNSGKPVVLERRVRKYLINAMMIDAKIYISDNPVHQSYKNALVTKLLETYFEFIRKSQNEISEYEHVYFRPIRTLGSALFNVGDNVEITLPLNMTFKLKLHVDPIVIDNQSTRKTITDAATKIVEECISGRYISMVTIGDMIKEKISYVASVDILGINGVSDLQTLSIVDDSVQPSIAQTLYLTKNNTLDVKKALSVEFVAK